jgi:tripartite-type tricarboxylate transporter receptor subunit TctC
MRATAWFCCIALFALQGQAVAQTAFPSRPLRYVVPLPPGAGADFIGRTVAEKMSADLGKPVVVENRAGASGSIGSEYVARSPADGHTLLQCYIATHGTNPAVSKLPYDAVKDFAPVGMVAVTPNVLVVNDNVRARSLAEFVALAKAKAKNLSYGSTGTGSATHLTMAYLEQQAGIELVHVPYKGAAPATTDLLGGQVDAMFPSLVTALPHIRAGRLRALAVSAARRSPLLPEVPTVAESGYAQFDSLQWYALCAPAGTPKQIVDRLNRSLNAALTSPEVRDRLGEQAADVLPTTPAEAADTIRREVAKWTKLVKDSGLKLDQ